MNAISNALSEVKFSIPMDILNAAFIFNVGFNDSNTSIDDRMLNMVVRPRVLVDCNIVGGIETVIDLSNLNGRSVDNTSIVYHIPKEMLNGKSIVSVLSVAGGAGSYSNSMQNSGLSMMNDFSLAGARVQNSMSSSGIPQTARVELIGENTVMVQGDTFGLNTMRVVVENNVNLSNINPRSYGTFSKLVVLAVEAYIHNTLIINMDKAFLHGGHELGSFKEYVDGLSDSNELYKTILREEWMKVAFMNDSTRYSRFLKLMVSPGL